MRVSEYLDRFGWSVNCSIKTKKLAWACNVGFINNEGFEDETQFSVSKPFTEQGKEELEQLFSSFCKENGFNENAVMYVEVVQVVETSDELE